MDYDAAYEVSWYGKDNPQARTAMVSTIPGGFILFLDTGFAVRLAYDDDRDTLLDEEAQGIIELRIPEIRIVLQKIGRAEYEKLYPFLPADAPKDPNDEQANAYVRKRIERVLG